MVGPLGEDVGIGVLEEQVVGRGVKGGGGVEVAKEGISEEGGVVVGVEGD